MDKAPQILEGMTRTAPTHPQAGDLVLCPTPSSAGRSCWDDAASHSATCVLLWDLFQSALSPSPSATSLYPAKSPHLSSGSPPRTRAVSTQGPFTHTLLLTLQHPAQESAGWDPSRAHPSSSTHSHIPLPNEWGLDSAGQASEQGPPLLTGFRKGRRI